MIDAHHHIWRQQDLPWLMGPEQPRIFGEYGAIRRDYLIEEYLKDIHGNGIEKSVYVQANWEPSQAIDEAKWVQSVSDEYGWPNAIVAYADFTVEDVRPQLDALSKVDLVRGIRQQFHWHENPAYRFAPHANLASDENVKRNMQHFSDYGWSFDLQVFADQMSDAAQLIEDCPDVTFILQHSGMLEDISGAGIADWEEGMRKLAVYPNMINKLSAFGTFIHRNDPSFISDMIHRSIAIFGADRCMFGSNFPIEKLWTSYDELFAAFKSAAKVLSQDQQNLIFKQTAMKIYRL